MSGITAKVGDQSYNRSKGLFISFTEHGTSTTIATHKRLGVGRSYSNQLYTEGQSGKQEAESGSGGKLLKIAVYLFITYIIIMFPMSLTQ